ncbi:MAG: recombinase family protein [Candidatus Pacebacteria bacterium]|nr:recombinase family protein [Candidatus Paceibacterota bacterium]MCF7862766.1 recombinase family protein [Candidatus Paceibacterota bacterium]
MEKNKCVIYCRVSSREQEETGYSLPAQEKLLVEYATRKGFDVVKVFSIAESASGSKQRKIFGEMIEFISKKNIPILLCEKVDRLTRNLKEAVVANDWIEADEKRQIHFVKQNLVIHRNAKSDEKFRWDIEIVLAKKYISNLSEEVKKGQKEKIAQGWLPAKPPLGYKTVGEKGHKTHVFDETKAPFMRKAFEYYSTGNYSLISLREKLYEDGLRTRNGSKLSKSRLEDILRDPFYMGSIRWNDITYTNGLHAPLVSKELFEKVQFTLTRGKSPHYKRHTFQFSKMIECGECGGSISGEIQKGTIYYSCKHNRPCTQKGMTKETDLDTSLMGVFSFFENITEKEADIIRDRIKADHKLEAEYKENTLKALDQRYNSLQRQLDILYNDRLSEKITPEKWESKQKEINAEQAEIQNKITKLKNEETKYFELYINILDLARRAREIYEKRSPEERRLLLSHIFSNLILKDKKANTVLKSSVKKISKRIQERIDAQQIFELKKPNTSKVKSKNSTKYKTLLGR